MAQACGAEAHIARTAIGFAVKPLPTDHYFSDETVSKWIGIAERHRLRDEQFLPVLAQWFRPGPILEIGAATGHLSEILCRRGYDAVASDYSPALVRAAETRGIAASVIDATADIREQTGRTFSNVLAQNVLPLIWRDRIVVRSTVAAIHDVLDPGGRLICISSHPGWEKNPKSYFAPREQIAIAQATGLFRLVTRFPHQVIPTDWYRHWNARIFNFLDFHAAHLLAIRLVWVMEKI